MWRHRLHDAACLSARLATRGAVLRVFIVFCVICRVSKSYMYTQRTMFVGNDGKDGAEKDIDSNVPELEALQKV